MNETGNLDRGLLKSLFACLVKRCGGHDASAARLGISRQRVGQMCSANPEHARDLPTWEHVWALEEACGQSVVFQALADQIEPPAAPRNADPVKETHDVVQAAAAMLPLAAALNAGDPKTVGAFNDGLARLQREAVEAQAAANVVQIRGAI